MYNRTLNYFSTFLVSFTMELMQLELISWYLWWTITDKYFNSKNIKTLLCSKPNYNLKMDRPSLFSVYFRSLKQTLQFLQQINAKKSPSSAGIQTHDLSNMSYHPQSLDQGSRPNVLNCYLECQVSKYWIWQFYLTTWTKVKIIEAKLTDW